MKFLRSNLNWIENKKAVFISNVSDIPRGIHWLDNIEKEKLNNYILSCDYYFINAFDHHQRTVEYKLEVRRFKFNVINVPLNEIMLSEVAGIESLPESLYYWLVKEAKESYRNDKKASKLKWIKTDCDEKKDITTLLKDKLKDEERLNIQSIIENGVEKVWFNSPYTGENDFELDIRDQLSLFDTDEEVFIKKAIARITG